MKLKKKIRNSLIKNIENIQLINLKEYYFNKHNDDFILSIFNELNDLLFTLKSKKKLIFEYELDRCFIKDIDTNNLYVSIKKSKNNKNQYLLFFEIKNQENKKQLTNVVYLLNYNFEIIDCNLYEENLNFIQKLWDNIEYCMCFKLWDNIECCMFFKIYLYFMIFLFSLLLFKFITFVTF